MKKYTVQTELDNNEVVIPIPEELISQLGWKPGDTLKWIDKNDGSFILEKAKPEMEKEIILVDCIQMFRMRYAVEVPKGKTEYALDTVTCGTSNPDFKEFSQLSLGETISSYRVVDEKELLEVFDKDNDYLLSWTKEKKLDTVVNTWKEQPEDTSFSEYYFDHDCNK